MTTLAPPIEETRFYSPTLAELCGLTQPDPDPEPWIPELEKPTLVIGDVHGNFDRLEALLKQEGIVTTCPDCDGSGDTPDLDMCPACNGDGFRRTNFDVEVVQLGDLGHFGGSTGSPGGDMLCYQYADRWLDVMLWGNHDRAVIDPHHVFSGFEPPERTIIHLMHLLYAKDKLKLAHTAHGFLITHAGLQAGWKQQKGIEFERDDPEAFCDWINDNDWWPNENDRPVTDSAKSAMAVRDAISVKRGGWSPTGGILWRDQEEKLYDGMKQVYGHSAQRDNRFVVQKYGYTPSKVTGPKTVAGHDAFNIDIGSKYAAHLGAVWLPERRLVRVDL